MISTGRQQRNRTLSLPLALRQLEAAGNLGNLRLAIVGKRAGYRGPVFMDSDIYKTPGGGRLGELGRGGDQELAAFDEETTALLEKAQQPDGYLNSAVQVHGQPRYSNLAHSHEMHCASHLIQAGVACLRAAGLDRLLGVARRFADHLVTRSWASWAGWMAIRLWNGSGGAVPGDRAPAVPGAGQPVDRAARARADR
jgi:uncharacterized protein